jgi:sensor histidine kinase YesM
VEENKPKIYIYLILWLSLAISILVHFRGLFDEFISTDFQKASIIAFILKGLMELFITFVLSIILFLINFFILKPFRTDKKHSVARFTFAFIISFTAALILSHYMFGIKNLVFIDDEAANEEIFFIFKDMFISLVVLTSVYVIMIINLNQYHKLEIKNLKIEVLQKQFDALRNQVSPHFLFNSLNSLKSLIDETPVTAQKYVDHLALVLRYTLQASENSVISLREELEFLNSYFFLVKLRFNKNISLSIDIKPELQGWNIPPLSLQMLVENAIKHNEISRRNALIITIRSTINNSITVKNNINKKRIPEPGTGSGLSNLSNQYRILCGKDIEISRNNGFFIVEIPLIES